MMAKLLKTEQKDHRVRIQADAERGELLLVRGGPKRAYLWAARDGEECVTFSGEKVLRKLAKEIIAELQK